MAKNEIPKGDEKLIDIFTEMISLDLYPNSVEEAEAIIKEAGIDLEEFGIKSKTIFRGILSEFADDWRNVSESVMSAKFAKLETFELRSNLSKENLIEKIRDIVIKISASGQAKKLSVGLAHRNFNNQTKNDLAQLLRELEYVASELSVEIEDK